MNVAYVRVSTVEQNEARQIEALEKYNIEKWYTEKVSAKDTNRPELQTMLDFVREGDTIFIHDFSRLAHLVSNKENLNTNTPQGKLMLTMFAAFYEFERVNMLERQAEGIKIAKEQGKYKGRRPVNIDSDTFEMQYTRYMNREINKVQLAQALKVSRPTLDKMLKERIA